MRRKNEGLKIFLKIGLPMVTLLVGCSVGMSVFLQGRNEMMDKGRIIKDNPNYHKDAKPFSLEEEFEKMQKRIDLEKFDNKRVPRPPGEE